jgi:hypothetical protein
MKQTRLLIVAVLVPCLLAGGYYYWTYEPINKSSFDRIRLDMTPTEVEVLLGRKPDYSRPGVATWVAKNGDQITITLLDGRTFQRFFRTEAVPKESVFECAVYWLGLRQKVRE